MTEKLEVQIVELSNRIAPLLKGYGPDVQSGALADLVAIYLAGNFVPGDRVATETMRAELLDVLIECARELVGPNEHIMGVDKMIDGPAVGSSTSRE
jgi:hypothetical protein